jgi:hypothetical protein
MADLSIVPSDLSTLDRGLLEALVIAQQKQMLAKDEAIAAHHEKLISRDNEIEHLKLVIAKPVEICVQSAICAEQMAVNRDKCSVGHVYTFDLDSMNRSSICLRFR